MSELFRIPGKHGVLEVYPTRGEAMKATLALTSAGWTLPDVFDHARLAELRDFLTDYLSKAPAA